MTKLEHVSLVGSVTSIKITGLTDDTSYGVSKNNAGEVELKLDLPKGKVRDLEAVVESQNRYRMELEGGLAAVISERNRLRDELATCKQTLGKALVQCQRTLARRSSKKGAR